MSESRRTMGVVPVFSHGDHLTRHDLESIADDRHRYELVDGVLLMSPSPRPLHQRVVARVLARITPLCPPDCEALPAPVDVVLAEDTVMIPDVLIGRRRDFTDRALVGTPVLAVEVVSPSSRLIDRHLKPARLAAAGCPHYWIIDPSTPDMTCFDLVGEEYAQVATATGEGTITLTAPFPITFSPADLVSDY
ncbi:Uma2 family endonuclease [Actinokineospora sp. NBRC 105648]|uniref:Uma2 family endonuclease n=1 Tax=Actinokineospora sp. NBRC 105648 TaxID=3032206 RepID=UPI002552DA3E|nr:Uma2 family endonuclease [Actinokineospora sp. NBRC 105648]